MADASLWARLSPEDRAFLNRSAATQTAFAARWLVDLPADLRPACGATPPNA